MDAAVKTMKKDEISLVSCDSSYTFGDKGREEWGIEPNMSVEYEVHLKSFEQVLKSIYYTAKNDQLVVILMKIRLNNVLLPTLFNAVNNIAQSCYTRLTVNIPSLIKNMKIKNFV